MFKKIACISIVILIVGALSLPCFAFEVPTYDEDTMQLVYYVSGQDDLFYVKDKNSYFLYNPTDSVQTLRLTLTNYFNYRSRFYIITSYSWINNNNCSIQYSSKFSDTTTYTFTDFIGGDYQSDFVSFVGTINPDGTDNVDFDTREVFCEISVNPGKVCAFQFAYNRIPPVNDDGPGFDSAALMDDKGLMAYTVVLYNISSGLYTGSDGSTPAGSEFAFFDIFNQIGQFTKLRGYNNGLDEGLNDGKNLGYNQGFEDGKENGYSAGYSAGVLSGEISGYDRGVADTLNRISSEGFENVTTFKEAYDLGVQHVETMILNNKDLERLVPTLFGSVLNSVYDFLDSFMSLETLFGFDVKSILVTIVSVSLAVTLFGFLTSKIGGG